MPRHTNAHRLFFPAAAAHATAIVPLSVHAMITGRVLLPGLAGPMDHARELIFGFALATIAGYLINRIHPWKLAGLFALWGGARYLALLVPASPVTGTVNTAFAVALAAVVAPAYIKSAKKWRNRALPAILVAFSVVAIAFQAGATLPQLRLQALYSGILLLLPLMLFMAGRMIAPAAAGHIRLRGDHLEARVQPRLEGALLLLCVIAVGAAVIPGGRTAAGLALLAAGGVALARLLRWRLWLCIDRNDLRYLGVGYAWLVAGLLLLGGALTTGAFRPATALHAITVGALGTLAVTVMARTRLLRARGDAQRLRGIGVSVSALAAATVLRVGWPDTAVALQLAAILWSVAFLVLLIVLLRKPR